MKFRDEAARSRLGDLVSRLEPNVVVLPGLGAGESVMRRDSPLREVGNYYRRSGHAIRLLGPDRQELQDWVAGVVHKPARGGLGTTVPEIDSRIFERIHSDVINPSYAVVLKIFELQTLQMRAISSIRQLADFCGELNMRGSRELLLGILLFAGTRAGRELASNLMKSGQHKDFESTRRNLWNVSFDLAHSRMIGQASLAEFVRPFPRPAAFVTDDRWLGDLLSLVAHIGAVPSGSGGLVTLDMVEFGDHIRTDYFAEVSSIVATGTIDAHLNPTVPRLAEKTRRYKAQKYIHSLESSLMRHFTAPLSKT